MTEILCPDCDNTFGSREEFTEHRELAHPPQLITVATEGIRTDERFGYQADPEEE